MRFRMILPLSVLVVGLLGTGSSATAGTASESYNLERTEVRGYVEYIDDQVAYLKTDYGELIAVQLGPESYWNAHHYYLPAGEYVTMDVWYDPLDVYTEWYFVGEIWGPDFHYVFANHEGVPYWVIFDDDYYYSLGYRASCVSYMVWYDCPPVYFVYLILPPPPPRIYVCFYGPRWRHHHFAWHYGPRFGRGGTYWHDRRGYQPPGHPGHDSPRNGSRSRDYASGNDDDSGPRPMPLLAEKQKNLYEQKPRPSTKQQSRSNQRTVATGRDYQKQAVTSTSVERKATVSKSASKQAPVQQRSSESSKQIYTKSVSVNSKSPAVTGNSRSSRSNSKSQAIDSRDKGAQKRSR
ncbi:MAG: hypothetical protein ACOZB3_02780 [Calditrichota bacterium]